MNIKYINFRKKAEELFQDGKLKKAYVLFDEALKYANEKQKIDILYFQALINDELENYLESNKKFFEIYDIDENESAAIYGIAMSYEKLKIYDKAEEYYKNCIDKNPKYDRAYFFLANLYDYLDRYDEAIKYYKMTVKLVPDDYMAYNNLGAIYENTNQFNLAIESLDKSICINPNYFRPYFNKGVVYGRIGNIEKAIQYYLKSKELNPGYCNIYLNISALYISQKMYKESIRILNEGINSSCSNKANLYYNRSCSHIKLGEINASMIDLKKSIDLNEELKDFARDDEDFKNIKDMNVFNEIVGD